MRTLFVSFLIIVSVVNCDGQLVVGGMAPEITLPDTNDSLVTLSSFRGKVVLIDFWASWCGPCRAAIPSIKRVYKKYNAMGLEVIGVSIDTKKDNWLKAIRQDKLKYTQVNDSGGWNSALLEQYFVIEIPLSFLLDKTGKIVAINEEGAKLERKIKQLLKE